MSAGVGRQRRLIPLPALASILTTASARHDTLSASLSVLTECVFESSKYLDISPVKCVMLSEFKFGLFPQLVFRNCI